MKPGHERGYAMAALLVGLSVMSIVLSMALPVWRTAVKREREAELVFRGEQYARAIELFSRRNGGSYPPSFEVLEEGRYIRKLYKDPMTGEGDFQPVYFGQVPPGQTSAPVLPGGGGPGGEQIGMPLTPSAPAGRAGQPLGGVWPTWDHRSGSPSSAWSAGARRSHSGCITATTATTNGRLWPWSRHRRPGRPEVSRIQAPDSRVYPVVAAGAPGKVHLVGAAGATGWVHPVGAASESSAVVVRMAAAARPLPDAGFKDLAAPDLGILPVFKAGSRSPAVDSEGHRWAPEHRSTRERLHDGVVHGRPHLPDGFVRARRVDAVREQHHIDAAFRIDPERRAGEARVPEGPPRHAAAA